MENEKRLIDANELSGHKFPTPMKSFYARGWNDALAAVMENAPTVDAVVLPCKVGDILYTFCIKGIDDYFIRESVVSRIEISEDFGIKIIERRKDPSGAYFYFQVDIDEIGKSIFLTKEEALKKMGR